MKHIILSVIAVMTIATATALPALASGDTKTPPPQNWSFDGPFGTYDRASLQRGLKVYREVCSACHGMKRIAFRNLSDLGYNEEQLKSIAAEYTVIDGPDDEGEMFERAARPSDYFPSPFPNDNAAKAANGALPPDLSLIVKARHDGANYIRALLTGYEEAPEGHHTADGQYWNPYISGHIIAMAPPLSDDQITYEDGTPQTTEQYATDIAHFLAWTAEPEMEHRKRLGIATLIFLIAFAGVMYGVKKKIWSDVH